MDEDAPVVSVVRLAARPVGAARAIEGILGRIRPSINLTRGVLPVPGPPVTIKPLYLRTAFTASL